MRGACRSILALMFLTALAVPASAQDLHLRPLSPETTVKPQSSVDKEFEVHNLQDKRVEVRFTIKEGGRTPGWNILLPAPMVLGPDAMVIARATIVAPYETGYNDGKATFLVEAVPYDPGTDQAAGQPAVIELGVSVEGWYVPGPSGWLLALLVIGLAAARRN